MTWLLASSAGVVAQTPGAAPTYQRSRVPTAGQFGPPRVSQPGQLDRARWPLNQNQPGYDHSNHGTPNHRPPHHRGQVQAPSIASGTFQRPYPFHLDYYKQKFGGSYDPYFGNLYGPPNVVLATPFVGGTGFVGGPGFAGDSGFFPTTPWPQTPLVETPQGGSQVFCPHCGQPL